MVGPPVRVSSADVGHRVVVRRRITGLSGPTGAQAYTDVLGILEHWDETTLRVRRSDGNTIEMQIAEVAHAKRVPNPPPRRSR